jgi:uncharacterized protein (TIGR00255 family)
MARSMTAYGRAHAETDAGLFLIEIHSVNRRSLDINFNLPKELLMFDMALRQRLGKEVRRGYVSVRITREDIKSALPVMPNGEVLKELHTTWKKCASDLGYDPNEAIPFNFLLSYALSMMPSKDCFGEAFKKQLDKGFEKALDVFLEMKEKEGKALLEDIHPRLDSIEKKLEKIEGLIENAPKRYHDKLAKRLAELKISHEDDEDRLMRELVIFAEKVDVTEEITRLRSHVKQFREIISSDMRRVGKELDFLIQEMNREVNTIAAKSQELEITQNILSVKSEQEKIREQLQNIE